MSNNNWNRIGLIRRAGVLIPLFSVYSKRSLGIGEFEDLKLIVDWCVKTGNSIIQLLPMNEVGSTFCPYDSLSSFALEPMYISLGLLKKGVKMESIRADRSHVDGSTELTIDPERSRRVDYRVKEEKTNLLWNIYLSKKHPSSNKGLKIFCDENAYWLDDFSLFKALKIYHGQAPWYEWNEGYKNRDSFLLEQFAKEHKEEISFYKWTQAQAFKQFKDAKDYAESKKVLLKGDLPMLVSRDSADVWAHPEFFKLEYAAGAPPDMYCAKGQRWGMPTYNWDCIEANEFVYVKEKLKFAENFYDILRIDHVVGLFRIWSIPYNEPMENHGLNGFFDPADEKVWPEHGKKLLSVLQNNTSIVLCAEDLGIIPKVCPDTLKEMEIPGNDVQRWTKDWKTKHDFLRPEEYRKFSVAMLSTHDTANWSAWWENEAGTVDEDFFIRRCQDRQVAMDAVKERLFDPTRSRHGRLRWKEEIDSVKKLTDILGKPPEEIKYIIELYENTYLEKNKLWKYLNIKGAMRESASSKIVKAALEITAASESFLCIELIFDLLSLADIYKDDPYQYRINRPGTVSPDNWSLKIPISLEELLKHKVNKAIKEIVVNSGRA